MNEKAVAMLEAINEFVKSDIDECGELIPLNWQDRKRILKESLNDENRVGLEELLNWFDGDWIDGNIDV